MVALVTTLLTVLLPTVLAPQPPVITGTLYVGTIGWGPRRADPVRAYDTASGELIFNSYDTLIQMANDTASAYHPIYPSTPVPQGMNKTDFEPYWNFEPMLATNVPDRVELQRTFTETTYPWMIEIANETVLPPYWQEEPVCTWWEDDVVGEPYDSYHITSWNDTNGNGILDLGDLIYLNDYWWTLDIDAEVNLKGAGWWLVEDVQFYPQPEPMYKLVLTYLPNLREVVRTEEYITYAPTYTLKKKPVETYSETLYNETTVLVRGVDYTIEYKTGLVTFLAAPVMDYLADYSWIKTTTYPVSTWLTSTATPETIYFLNGWVDNNPDEEVGFCDVVYLMEYEIVPVMWEKLGQGFTLLPVTKRTWHIIDKTGTLWQLHRWYYDFNIRTTEVAVTEELFAEGNDTNTQKVFYLENAPVKRYSEVFYNETELVRGVNYTIDYVTGMVTFTNPPRVWYYANYSYISNPIYFVNEIGSTVDFLDIHDAEYSLKRGLVQDQVGSPMWMYYKPFFDQMNSDYWATGDPEDAIGLSWLINDTIEVNPSDAPANTLRINLGIDFPDNAFKQILCQTWGAIVSKEFSKSIGCWDGNLSTDGVYKTKNCLPDWFEKWRHVDRSPYDNRTGSPPNYTYNYRYCGTGPYRVTFFGAPNIVVLIRNTLYWRGWKLVPNDTVTGKKGFLNRIEIYYIANWDLRRDTFTGCDLDVCAVPRAYMMQLLDPGDPDYMKTLDPAIITIKNINPQLTMDAMHFTFTINPASEYIYNGSLPDGVPTDFFNNTYVRKAFAYGFEWDTYLRDAYYDEAVRPFRSTPLVYGLYPDYYDNTIPGYYLSQSQAEACLKNAMFNMNGTMKSVWETGFHLALAYNGGNDQIRIACEMLANFFADLSTYDNRMVQYPNAEPFIIHIKEIDWSTYLDLFENMELPIFSIGWLADFADADNWIRPYIHSYGDFSYFQNYTSWNGWGDTKDTLIDLAVKTPDGTARKALYKTLQEIYVDDCPSFPMVQPSGRRWQKYYVRGWYYNGLYPSQYYYSMWKENTCWYDVTGSETPGISDGVVDIFDVYYFVKHFNGRQPNPSHPTLDPKWVGTYGCGGVDPRGDRVCNIFDISGAVRHFLHRQAP